MSEWGAWCCGLVESLLTLRALYVPGLVNRGAELACRGGLLPVEWRLNPSMVEQIWTQFRTTKADLSLCHPVVTGPLFCGPDLGQFPSSGEPCLRKGGQA